MIRDKTLTQLCTRQVELFEHGTPAQRESVFVQIQERQRELRKLNKGDGEY